MRVPSDIAMRNMQAFCREIHEEQIKKGFWDSAADNFDRKLMLLVGEVIEAHEELRSNENPLHIYERHDGKPEGFLFELADVQIRLADLVGSLDADFGAIVLKKHEFNLTRPYKHERLY